MEENLKTPAFGVLAGGRSSRMGQDKAALILNGKTFLQRVLEAGETFPERLVSLAAAQTAPELPPDVTAVRDEREASGPMEGIRQILRACKAPACLMAAADMPFLTGELLRALAAQYPGSGNLVLTLGGRPEPLCSIYCRECVPVIEQLQRQGLSRPALLFDRVPTKRISLEELGFSPTVVENINEPAQYRALIGGSHGA